MTEELFVDLADLQEVEAIALGGSRAGNVYDEKSDYDVYVYVNSPINEDIRKRLLSKYCSCMEIGNHFWEYEDNCTLNNGIDIDILYRDMESFMADIENVVIKCLPHNAYTTCMWHNLLTCRIMYDKEGKLTAYRNKYNIPYPRRLKKNIIEHQLKLIDSAMPAYPVQIRKAVLRNDTVSINHRTTEFLASYFDLIFAVNEKTHPGEKRLIDICKRECEILPSDFEENLSLLFSHLYAEGEERLKCLEDISRMVKNVKAIV